MADIFDEVEEDLRAERAKRILRRYGWAVLALLLLVLAGLAGWQVWQGRRTQGAEAGAEAFLAATRETEAQGADLRAAADRFATLAGTATEGYRILAGLRAAALKDETGQHEAALALYERLAGDADADPLYRELASLMWVVHSLDTGDPAALEARLAPLTRADGPWRASAQEAAALVAIRRGDTASARRTLQALSGDVTAPAGVRDRAGKLLSGLEGG
ncbi:tetratricopeptide repeat protein [Roseomonas sp. NAR14]|uniref:Tetratricopeptide repeat protein n=1 Tax=Roseomonas acroporae TaxID=2937791 RepID=A0A9X1Y7X4_9PROT|nr:tetratricopeptide repeat protein [Roseomonas acroporae]MCK8784747.1 tetratricopeptide repeat protein [Roseomonas acroporae]